MVGAALLACIGILIAAALRRDRAAHSIGERRSAQVSLAPHRVAAVHRADGRVGRCRSRRRLAQDQFVYAYPQPLLKVALAVGVVATGLSVLGIATLVPVWRERTWPIGRRLRHSAAVALFVALVATLLQWNAIGFRYYLGRSRGSPPCPHPTS